jgi:hypothetical protein
MGDRRRSSLLDQMAMVAESQKLIDYELSDDNEEDVDEDDEEGESTGLRRGNRDGRLLEEGLLSVDENDDDEEDDDDEDDEDDRVDVFDEHDGRRGRMMVHSDDDYDDEDHEALLYAAANAYGGGVGMGYEDIGSVMSHVGSVDELDEFEGLDNPMPLEYSRISGAPNTTNNHRTVMAAAGGGGGVETSAVPEFPMSTTASSSEKWIEQPNNMNNGINILNNNNNSNNNSFNTLEIPTGSNHEMSSSEFFGASASGGVEGGGGPTTGRRASFTRPTARRDSHHSAPSRHDAATFGLLYGDQTVGGTPVTGGGSRGMERRRPLSISVPSAHGAEMSRRKSAIVRRPSTKSFALGSGGGGGSSVGPESYTDDDSQATGKSGGSGAGLLGSIRGRRRSTRRANMSINAKGGGVFGNLDTAIESLRKQDSNNEWENVAAAAAVVAAGSVGGQSKKSYVQFAVNETVLVFLTLLNVTNMEDPKDTFTIAPVNKFGFPAGEGGTEAERASPHSFVLATVTHVHFDEDDRYYTILRADTGTEQRADSGAFVFCLLRFLQFLLFQIVLPPCYAFLSPHSQCFFL